MGLVITHSYLAVLLYFEKYQTSIQWESLSQNTYFQNIGLNPIERAETVDCQKNVVGRECMDKPSSDFWSKSTYFAGDRTLGDINPGRKIPKCFNKLT